MTPGHRKRRRCRAFSVDLLEGRTLLNAAHPSAPTAEVRADNAGQVLHIKLTGSNRYSSSFFLGPEQVMVYDINAQGRAGSLGRGRLQASYNTASNSAAGVPGKVFEIWQGTGTLIDSRGDQLSVAFSGSETFQRGKSTFSLSGSVAGTTGSLANTTGTFSATGKAPTPKTIQLAVMLTL